MKLEDLLRHIADNIENGRQPFIGLDHPFIADQHEKLFLYPEKFSLAPRTHVVNGFKVPAPEIKEPKHKDKYWASDYTEEDWACNYVWQGLEFDRLAFERRSVFLTKEAAVANAKAEKGIDPDKD